MNWHLLGVLAAATLLAASTASAQPHQVNVLVPMRDGVLLSADAYLPTTSSGPWPAILVRTPYNKSADANAADSAWIAEVVSREYVYVVQDTRGRYASQGADSTFWTDGWNVNQDGYDTVEWVAAQAWCDGNVGMYGESARGIVQYLAAGAVPPSLKACVVRIAADDLYAKAFFQGGAYRKVLVENWYADQNATDILPFFLAHPTRDGFWDYLDLATRASMVTVPILHIGGHYDAFGESAIDAFNLLQENGGPGAAGNQKLVLGPWTHYGINRPIQGEIEYPDAVYDLETLRWRWFDRWLRGEPTGVEDEPPVTFYLMGDVDAGEANIWMDADAFPPTSDFAHLYLHGPYSATPRSLQPWPSEAALDAFWYDTDPTDPMPTLGGRNLFIPAGPHDQQPIHAGRTDGIAVTTPPLSAPVTVAGKVRMHLWAECSAVDTDWCVKLIDVYPDDREMLVTDGVLKARFRNGCSEEELLVPWRIYEFEVDLWSTAIQFDTGHRIMVTITNANSPRFEVNPQTGAPFGEVDPPVSATVGIHASPTYPSYLELPILQEVVGVGTGWVLSDPGAPLRIVPRRNPSPRFALDVAGRAVSPARLTIFSVGGRAVHHLTLGSAATSVVWDGRLRGGTPAPEGIYFLELRDATGRRASSRLVLMR